MSPQLIIQEENDQKFIENQVKKPQMDPPQSKSEDGGGGLHRRRKETLALPGAMLRAFLWGLEVQ